VGPLLVYSAVTMAQHPSRVAAYAALLLAAAHAALLPRVDYRLRGLLLVASLTFVGTALVRYSGPAPGALLAFTVGGVLAAVVFGAGASISALALNATCFSVAGIAGRHEGASLWAEELPRLATWPRMTVTYTVVTGLLVLLVSSAVRRAEQGLAATRASLADAVRERNARAEVETRLRANEERLRLAVEAARMGTWEWDVASGRVTWGGELESMVGLPPGGFAGTLEAFQHTVDPEDRPAVDEAIAAVLHDPAAEYDVQYRVRGSGPERWLESKGRVYRDSEGRPILMRGATMDVTARKRSDEAVRRSEAELRALFASMEDVILVLDRDGRYLRIAPTSPSLLYRPREELLGRRLHDVFPAEQADFFLGQIQRCLERRQTLHFEYTLPIGGAATRFTATVSPLLEDSVVWVARDVTVQTRLQAELRRGERLAAMGSLVAAVAHEVRTPLFSLSATLDTLEARLGTPDQQQELRELLRSQVQRLASLMQDLLEYGRPPALKLSADGLPGVVDRAVESCRQQALEAGVSVSVDVPDRLPAVLADASRLQQVFENLVANALQHSPRGTTVTVSAAAVPGPPGSVACRVQDQGAGVAGEDLERVFEPFFSRRKGGTGMGLAIAQRLVEAHGGSLTAENHPQGGAVFTVVLPAAPTAGAGDAVA
jgi:PAS domain S-box-containing protein